MQNVFTLEINKYKIKLENFEGPLDLLCHLIDENKMDIYDISLSEITDQYIEYINMAEKMNLEVTSEFLIMASNLLYIKSKKLLPRQEEEEEMELNRETVKPIDIKETSTPSKVEVTVENSEYTTYRVYILREEDTLESVMQKYSVTREQLEEYNPLGDLKIGDKLIIPNETNY